MPNLLNYPGSVVVVDSKGENYAVTAGFRANRLGQQIVCLDPFGITGMTKRLRL
ncbi:MAG: type IV secretory system conjugative DNA transfer family protein [Synergistaceae bacterium]|nr:type IV secretory system conjugative DNA transfer family protein [Synergistaceae bacterium]